MLFTAPKREEPKIVLVLDTPKNQHWCKELIGKVMYDYQAPGWCEWRPVTERDVAIVTLKQNWKTIEEELVGEAKYIDEKAPMDDLKDFCRKESIGVMLKVKLVLKDEINYN